MANKRTSFTEEENKEAFEALHQGEWVKATDEERGKVWFKMNLVITDGQQFSSAFIKGYQDEERLFNIEETYTK